MDSQPFSRSRRMEFVRYTMAYGLFLTIPAAIVYWVLLHKAALQQRNTHGVNSLAAYFLAMIVTGAISLLLGLVMVTLEKPYRSLGVPGGLCLIVVGLWLEWLSRTTLGIHRMSGAAEVSPTSPESRLVTTGVYQRIRHPRYLAACLGTWGISLIVQSYSVYGLALIATAGAWWVAYLEDQELVLRFGNSAVNYQRVTGRFFPRLKHVVDPS
jgi:protein-S-isoprenylcysteine O-methyltransferase Ste14